MCRLYDSPAAKKNLKRLGLKEPNFVICEYCGEKCHVGDWGVCRGTGRFGGHEPQMKYHPFIAFYDIQLGKQINSLTDWNRAMKEGGWELADRKHDRPIPPPTPSVKGFDRHFNEAVRRAHGGILPVGNFLTEED